ncbi:MAG: hypothetical protein JNK84_06565 [Phreatobacter sp.]|uniref:hypothetical protein n=1 Tax=Phreatobacter sp. TaxID=1966341 RepID=UPI001A3872E0|nr:hypothetical protein [Phreatobacter sp.]MBL8568732.1 hypothetical protein [Phreatobacter sp.]
MTDIESIRRAALRKEIAALKAECLAFDAGIRAARLALWLRYDPDQPRVPAGSADGGQWTSAGGGGGLGLDPEGGAGDTEFGAGGNAPTGSDDGGDWKTIARGVGPDGTRTETNIRDDGTTIRSEYAASRAAGFDERHTVMTPDGSLRSFETEGLRQTVRDELGEVLSRSEFRPDGAVLEPAFLPLVVPAAPTVVSTTGQLGLILLGGLSTRNGPDGQAVAAFNAREFSAGTPDAELTYVGRLSQAEVQRACPGLGNVQDITNASAALISREGVSPSMYGTLVHTEIRDRIQRSEGTQPFRPGYFHAEHSFLKEKEAVRYGERGSVRVDVFEKPEGTATVCVYDVKTGRAGFPRGRMEEIPTHVRAYYGSPLRVILTEIRPRR